MGSLEGNRSLVQAFLEAINTDDRTRMLSLLDEHVLWSVPASAVPPYGGTHQGAELVVDMMLSASRKTFVPGSVRHEILRTVAEADVVVAETRMQARQSDERRYDNQYVFIFTIAHGRITEIREHVDTAYAIQFFS